MEPHGIKTKPYRLRRMKTRWGNCGKTGQILLNPELVTAPKTCTEYVIIHEICDPKHYNHGGDFFDLLELLVPN
ncbi:MAG: hypothetical protein Fues2KO_46900 [Fuerstiella sp.]